MGLLHGEEGRDCLCDSGLHGWQWRIANALSRVVHSLVDLEPCVRKTHKTRGGAKLWGYLTMGGNHHCRTETVGRHQKRGCLAGTLL